MGAHPNGDAPIANMSVESAGNDPCPQSLAAHIGDPEEPGSWTVSGTNVAVATI